MNTISKAKIMFFLEKNLCHFAVFEKNLEKKTKKWTFFGFEPTIKLQCENGNTKTNFYYLWIRQHIFHIGFFWAENSEVDVALQSHPAFRYIKKCDSIFKN